MSSVGQSATSQAQLLDDARAFCEQEWPRIVHDIERLVAIPSVSDPQQAEEGAPFGAGPSNALQEALQIAQECGFVINDANGYVGLADWRGRDGGMLGIVAHTDIVDPGQGWNTDPYTLTERDGYLIGRGVLDDKGPLVVALHAVRFWIERGVIPPFSVRVIIGTDEERAMDDVAYYIEHFPEPDFLFSPDGQFPLCYGEAGILHGVLESAPFEEGAILEFSGGQAPNAVAGSAQAQVRGFFTSDHPRIAAFPQSDGTTTLEAVGTAAHASTPEAGESAIRLLVDFLVRNKVGTPQEQEFLQLLQLLHGATDGSLLGLDCTDEHIGDLTAVGSMVSFEDGKISQTIDFRYPTTTSANEIARKLNALVGKAGATFTIELDKEPFIMDPSTPAPQALSRAYCAVAGKEVSPVTSRGGTYARCFKAGVSFGPDLLDRQDPEWVGTLHGANEGVHESLLKDAFAIYALALNNLMESGLETQSS